MKFPQIDLTDKVSPLGMNRLQDEFNQYFYYDDFDRCRDLVNLFLEKLQNSLIVDSEQTDDANGDIKK